MRLIARFAQEKETFFEIITVYDERIAKERLNKKKPILVSISKEYPAVVWFERKISDDFGIQILYSEDERPLIKHEHFPPNISPMRKNFTAINIEHVKIKNTKKSVNHGVIIAPTHPYHLESSQLQLFDYNKIILHFEMMPFYKYRGIEKMLEGMRLEEARGIVERISASSSIAYQTAFLDIELQASKKTLPEVIRIRHVFLLELERVINYLTDLSLLCQLVEFFDGAEFFIKFAEEGRKAMQGLTGHRFGFSSIRGDFDFLEMDKSLAFIELLEKELVVFKKWIEERDDILEKTLLLGQISKNIVLDYGLVGIMARSSGVRLDRRYENEFFEKYDYNMNVEEVGDTFSRFNIRIAELFGSLRMMKSLVNKNSIPFFLGTTVDGEFYTYVESSAGELMMYIALKNQQIERFFVRDPSFLNAQVLPSYIKNSEVSTLDLIIKSIPLNISAIDL
ncbi:MAG: Hydrogenase, group 4, HycE subunit, putative [uncultured Sulfurovum sp.]|uniref:Hydrogenase, group 4, HycE subunit, putative n=1 Tax=uncultured Sulfurovum sp. TaxID=269237 RepID=A0A6S6TF92_9BACT|nr:MAG: Hydrogenase, group 4, HycE subunit, putative [uncultured Sulfurovum sp.]